ncbi:MAG: ferrous iron transport protein A [Firmicutes bacterium]|nr:ferrous iron transport protein A [Bacillota bacterium]MCL1953348.1 ferrous iron transport protein A [Bacillota bacterium]
MLLSDFKKKNELKIIQKIDCDGIRKQRLSNLGFCKGVDIQIKAFAPLGDPMIVTVGGSDCVIRKSDARFVVID